MGFRLRQTYNIFASDFQAEMAVVGLRPVQLSILAIVDENPGIRQGKIGEALNIARENIAPLVNELEKAGHLERQRHPTDGRAFAIYLTPQGEDLLVRSKEILRQREKVLMSRLTPAEQQQLTSLLYKLVEKP
ncbi:MarR family winged helix-turn-helix transcriptional regulator [Kordiimonas marina]|uniref:MarR family winged helix-turn-helix transcriptional regulator n=1 Tax=Kordiimonas marina TaxID=2872312 RepID=UPI001FF42A9B|nr:MarR family transcriptional regulator [Kordiimonas marina]MCJ9427784.1 MarR family transcriptional regulator [Kordiimonas marina]